MIEINPFLVLTEIIWKNASCGGLKSGRPGGGVVWEIRTNPDKGREGGSKIQDFAGRPK